MISVDRSKYICNVIKFLKMRLFRRLVVLFLCVECFAAFAGSPGTISKKNAPVAAESDRTSNKDTVVIRFDYKQSALYHSFTFEVLDSVIAILKKNREVTLSIDGYAYKDEGSDTICYYLSLNRALFIQTYILGRGVDSSRIISVIGHGKAKAFYKVTDKDGLVVNCRAEVMLNYPPPPPPKVQIPDRDKDGIADNEDRCPDDYGYPENNGCPNTGVVIVPFESQQSNLIAMTYKVLDSVIAVLSENPALRISIEGHAYTAEGINSVCERLAGERALIVKNYLLSRRIDISRIDSVKNMSNTRPLNAGNNPQEIINNSRAEITFSSH